MSTRYSITSIKTGNGDIKHLYYGKISIHFPNGGSRLVSFDSFNGNLPYDDIEDIHKEKLREDSDLVEITTTFVAKDTRSVRDKLRHAFIDFFSQD